MTTQKSVTDPHIESMIEKVADYLYAHAKTIDKATLLKYAGIALLVFYGLRKSNLLSGIALTLISGLITNMLAGNDQNAGKSNEDVISALLKKLA